MTAPIAVLGVGNVLACDDGFGPSVIRRLEAAVALPAGVEVVDVGPAGLDLVDWMAERRVVILVDTVQVDQPPGTLVRLDRERLLEGIGRGPRISPHQPAIADTLHTAALGGFLPDTVRLIGVVPSCLDVGTGLSPEVEDALDSAVAAVIAELEALGVDVTPRDGGDAGDPWWQTDRMRPTRF